MCVLYADDVDNEDFQLTGSGNLQFTQNSAINDTQCRTVSIVDDQRIEIDEDFLAIFDTQDSVVIENNMAQVIIVDNEGAWAGQVIAILLYYCFYSTDVL